MQTEFSHPGYESLLTALLRHGYSTRGFADADPDKRDLILRHDIDMSLEAALALAQLEQRCGVQATYFVLLRSGLYNPFSGPGSEQLDRIRGLGHQIGLHFDASLYAPDRASLETACRRECGRLEDLLGSAVEVVSFHRPAEVLVGAQGRFADRIHTYEPRFVTQMGYCADSRGDWHYGHPLEHAAIAQGYALQLLTHPIWWDTRPGESAIARLDRFVRDHSDAFREELAANCQPYRDALAARAVDPT